MLLFALLLGGVPRLSFTADEPAHIAGGYALLAQGTEALSLLAQRGYPPLLCALEAAGVYFADPDLSLQEIAGWPDHYDRFAPAFIDALDAPQRARVVARLPVVLLTLGLGAVVYRWGADLGRPMAGLVALGVLVLDPTLLAHGRLATTDVGTVTFGTAALYAAWRWSGRPSWRWTWAAGALLGLAMLSKISGLLWTAAAVLIWSVTVWRRRGAGQTKRLLLHGLSAGLTGFFLLWGGYGFGWGWVRGLPLPLPAPSHWQSLRYLEQYVSEVYALGQRTYGSWWWYYVLAFAIKNPLPMLVSLAIGLAGLARRTSSDGRWWAIGLFPALYIVVAIAAGMNIGYRHMLPIHPFIYLAIGVGMQRYVRASGKRWWRWAAAALAVWYAAGTLRVWPYELAYFNELAGGPSGGYRYLSDSNVDWGQSADAMRAYLAAHPDARNAPPTSPWRPAPGTYVIQATHLYGGGIADPYAYEWFRHREPDAILEYSILVYEVPPWEERWFAQCTQPAAPLERDAIAAEMGRDDLRMLRFDCRQTWIYAGGETGPGIYALHYDLMEERGFGWLPALSRDPIATDPFVARHLAPARLSFKQARQGPAPPFVLYEMPPAARDPPRSLAVGAARSGARAQDLVPLAWPIDLEGPLAFLGAAAYRQGEVIEVETWWQVTADPISEPFSIVGHLVTADGETIDVADGLGTSPLTLFAGDVIVQRHRFSQVPSGPDLYLSTGAYWRDTMERWKVSEVPGATALMVAIGNE